MELENRYFVIKREKFLAAWEKAHTFYPDVFRALKGVTPVAVEEALDAIMSIIGHEYFVLNLDEDNAQYLAQRYLEMKEENEMIKERREEDDRNRVYCPDCGCKLARQEGCLHCPCCGWALCG